MKINQEKLINKIIPYWVWLPLLGCFFLNGFVYWSTQKLMAGSYHYDFTTSFDRSVPLMPEWVSVYIFSYFFWTANYIIIARESKEKCARLVTADFIAKIICGIIFIIIPTTNIRPALEGGFWDQCLEIIYSFDQPFNLFPSIHCLVSWICFAAIRDSKTVGKWYKTFSLIFALAICASTQFTKQHYIVDVVGGIFLAEIALYATGFKIRDVRIRDKLMNGFDKLTNRFLVIKKG